MPPPDLRQGGHLPLPFKRHNALLKIGDHDAVTPKRFAALKQRRQGSHGRIGNSHSENDRPRILNGAMAAFFNM